MMPLQDTVYEERVNQLVKSETALKLKLLETQKREERVKRELDDVEQALEQQHAEWKAEIDGMDSELENCKKREAKWVAC